MNTEKGFILTSHWIDGDRYPLQYFCMTANGPVLLKFDTEKFVFFAQSDKLNQSFSTRFEKKELPLKSFDGTSVSGIYCKNSNDFFNLKKEFASCGVRTFESDIWPTDRFTMERFINGSVEFAGQSTMDSNVRVYLNPQVKTSEYYPNLKLCSLDIETGVDGSLYSIGVHYSNHMNSNEEIEYVFMLSHENKKVNDTLEYFSSEKELLISFMKHFNSIDPDVIIGWHVIGFDLKFLENKCLKLNIPFKIGRLERDIAIDEKKGAGFFAKIPGRVVIDGPPAFRSAFYSFKNFKLETVASEILGTGKDIASDGGKVEEIERRFKEDKESLAKYNILDCKLVTDLYKKVNMIDFMINRTKVSGLLIDRLGISTAALDHVLLPRLHRKGVVAPNSSELDRDDNSSGGMVIEPRIGKHENVAVFDFKSLYPSLMRTFNIDPYSRINASISPLVTPAGVEFSRSESLLPAIIEDLMRKRERAKLDKNYSLNMAIKILMNSFYGLLGSFRCRFYHSDLPKAITESGHWLLKQTIEFFENLDYEVLYGDTDSLFVKLPSEDEKLAKELASKANDFITRLIKEEFKVDSLLDLEFEKTFSKIYFSTVRGSDTGAKKKYVGLINGELEFTGMEYVRSDWTDLAKKFQYNLFQTYFMGESVESYVKKFIAELKASSYDDLLVITKKLSKDPKEYTKNIPPHVKAALLVNHTGPYRLKEVSYIMTHSGPIPIQNDPSNIDYEYYVEKQIKPLADQVLMESGLSFDSIALGDQLTLF